MIGIIITLFLILLAVVLFFEIKIRVKTYNTRYINNQNNNIVGGDIIGGRTFNNKDSSYNVNYGNNQNNNVVYGDLVGGGKIGKRTNSETEPTEEIDLTAYLKNGNIEFSKVIKGGSYLINLTIYVDGNINTINLTHIKNVKICGNSDNLTINHSQSEIEGNINNLTINHSQSDIRGNITKQISAKHSIINNNEK